MKKIKNSERGFTLSEVIITLVVLGIVAAITVPMLSNSASDKKWNVARQKAQATIGEAFRLMTVNGEIDKNLSTQQFVEKIIPKYLKLEKLCGSGVAAAGQCGFKMVSGVPKIKRADGVQINLPTTISGSTWATTKVSGSPTTSKYNNSYFFRTLDGFSVSFFYNPYCASDIRDLGGPYEQNALDMMCLYGVYDMNGKAGPNRVGYDIGFVGSVYNGFDTKAVAVLPHYKKTHAISGLRNAENICKNIDKGENNWVVPDINQVVLMYVNRNLILSESTHDHALCSRTLGYNNPQLYRVLRSYPSFGYTWNYNKDFYFSQHCYVRCVRANALK